MQAVDRFTCEQVFQRLDDFLDRELTPEETKLVQEHLELCAWCASSYQFQKSVLSQVKQRVQQIQAPPDLLSRISKALQETQTESPS